MECYVLICSRHNSTVTCGWIRQCKAAWKLATKWLRNPPSGYSLHVSLIPPYVSSCFTYCFPSFFGHFPCFSSFFPVSYFRSYANYIRKFDLKIFYLPPYVRTMWQFKHLTSDHIKRAIDILDWESTLKNHEDNDQVSTVQKLWILSQIILLIKPSQVMTKTLPGWIVL